MSQRAGMSRDECLGLRSVRQGKGSAFQPLSLLGSLCPLLRPAVQQESAAASSLNESTSTLRPNDWGHQGPDESSRVGNRQNLRLGSVRECPLNASRVRLR
jgi:hypothetical protein